MAADDDSRAGEETPRGEREVFAPDAATEVREELDFHLAMLTREYEARGLSVADARAAALRRLGDMPRLQKECRAIA